jgi:hypothetical protein
MKSVQPLPPPLLNLRAKSTCNSSSTRSNCCRVPLYSYKSIIMVDVVLNPLEPCSAPHLFPNTPLITHLSCFCDNRHRNPPRTA